MRTKLVILEKWWEHVPSVTYDATILLCIVNTNRKPVLSQDL